MPRQDVMHSENTRIDQPDALVGDDLGDREPEIVIADADLINKEYQDELAFMAEWITLRLEPSGAENAPDTFPVWCNGRGAEVLVNDRPVVMTHLPVGPEITVRRSVVEIIIRSKTARVQSDQSEDSANLLASSRQRPRRTVSQTQPWSIIHDPSPRGRAWAAEMARRAF